MARTIVTMEQTYVTAASSNTSLGSGIRLGTSLGVHRSSYDSMTLSYVLRWRTRS